MISSLQAASAFSQLQKIRFTGEFAEGTNTGRWLPDRSDPEYHFRQTFRSVDEKEVPAYFSARTALNSSPD